MSNILAVLGAVAIVAGVSRFNVGAGLIALGLVFILGALATARLHEAKAAAATAGKKTP